MLINQYGELRSGWAVALVLLVFYVSQLLSGMVLGFSIAMSHLGSPAQGGGQADLASWAQNLATSPLFILLSELVTCCFLLLLFKLLYKRPLRQMGLSGQKWGSRLLFGGLFGIISITLVYILLRVSGQISFSGLNWSVLRSPGLLLWFLAFIGVGFAEEIAFRGIIMTALKTTRSKIAIVGLSALIFGLMHAGNENASFLGIVNVCLVGVLFAYLLIRTGSLWAPIGYHITWNFCQGNILGLNVSGMATEPVLQTGVVGTNSWLSGGSFGAEGSIFTTLILVLGLLYLRFVKRPASNPAWTYSSDLPLTRGPQTTPEPPGGDTTQPGPLPQQEDVG